MSFISENFLLQNETSLRLYHHHASGLPILDYHCHLSPREIAENRHFENLTELWLEGDHYKWRAMRANGEPERYCTGDGTPYEKFLAWARTVPYTLRNPLYHWTHLELKRYFGIDALLDERTAPGVWEDVKAQLKSDDFTAHSILNKFRVSTLCTTDDPTDSLEHHVQIAASSLTVQVLPAFRPDNALLVQDPKAFNNWADRLAERTNVDIGSLSLFLDALSQRHQDFHDAGCRLSDHGLDVCFAEPCAESDANVMFNKARGGNSLTPTECSKFASFMMLFLGRLDAAKKWTLQLHLGALRNANTRAMLTFGPNTGFDGMGEVPQIASVARYLDSLEQESMLPKIILYNSNPFENYALATLAGCFSESNVPGKVQFGSSWWFMDQKEGIEWQLNALSNVGLLSRFIGMVTDSRSFMSYPRHEYFRRLLCNLLGDEMERGLLPNDEGMVGRVVQAICFDNANKFLMLPTKNSKGQVDQARNEQRIEVNQF